MTIYTQEEAQQLKLTINEIAPKMLKQKRLYEFEQKLIWQKNNDIVVTCLFADTLTTRILHLSFEADMRFLFGTDYNCCRYIDEDANLDKTKLSRVVLAALRMLFLIYMGCISISLDLDHWPDDKDIKAFYFTMTERGSIKHTTNLTGVR